MKKAIPLGLFLVFCLACKSPVVIDTAIKQIRYGGSAGAQPITSFLIEFKVTKDILVQLDSADVVTSAQKHRVQQQLSAAKSNTLLSTIRKKGSYLLSLELSPDNIITTVPDARTNDQVTLYYRINNTPKKLVLEKFIEKQKTRR